MAISSGLRNRLVGFAIVISAIIILLPLVLSKDVLQREEPQAIAINSQGAKYDTDGNLQYQSSPNVESVLNLKANGDQLEFGQVTANSNALPSTNSNQSESSLAEANSDNSVEMLEFSSGAGELDHAMDGAQVEETLVANNAGDNVGNGASNVGNTANVNNTANVKPNAPAAKEEVLVAQNSKPAAQQPPKPPISSAKKDNGSNVVAGTKPKANYVIQVGVFSKKSNADNVVKKISGAGIKVYAVEVNSGGRVLYRVYAGAANNRNDLNDELQKIDKLCGTKGKIVSL